MDQPLSADEAFDVALRRYVNGDPAAEEVASARNFTLPLELVEKVNTIALKARVDIDAVVEIALKQYFAQGRTAHETLPGIIQELTGIRPAESAGERHGNQGGHIQQAPLRRRFDRARVNLPIVYSVSGTNAWRNARIIDLSAGGARMCAATEVGQGFEILIGFRLPEVDHKIVTRGRVVMSFFDGEINQYSHGLAFTAIADIDLEAILDFVHNKLGSTKD